MNRDRETEGDDPGMLSIWQAKAIRDLSNGRPHGPSCNMAIEGGARAGLIAPDDKTFEYCKGRSPRPKGCPVGRLRWTCGENALLPI